MKRLLVFWVMLFIAVAASAQSLSPVPQLITRDDVGSAIKFVRTHHPLSKYVHTCYRNVSRNAQIGSINHARSVAFCAEIDIAGSILSPQDSYFSDSSNRVGTELIAFAGLNTYQAYQTINWIKSLVKADQGIPSQQLEAPRQPDFDRAVKASEAMNDATAGAEKDALLACSGVRPTNNYPTPSKSTCIKYLKTFNLDSSYYRPIPSN